MDGTKDKRGSTGGRKAGVQVKKPPYNLKTRIVGQLRRLFLWHPGLKAVRDRTRVSLGRYICDGCKGGFKAGEMRCDHIEPVVDPGIGFVDWNTYIRRMFDVIPDGIQHLCVFCHKEKTALERKARIEAKHKNREAS